MKKTVVMILLIAALLLSLAGCGIAPAADTGAAGTQSVPAENAAPESAQPAPAEAPETSGRADGERFEKTILLEGMEETVAYEHVRNETVGFELDYEYEDLERRGDLESESFVSRWDDPDDPWNYLEVRRDTGNANLVGDALAATLKGMYDSVDYEESTLERAGACLRISASGAKDGAAPAGSLQTVYVIPAADGCLVATAHCTYESAEGFGARFAYMMNTLTLIGG